MSGPTAGGAFLGPSGGGAPAPAPWQPDLAKFVPQHKALAGIVKGLRAAGRRVVFTNGAFDLLHVGHVRSLRDARSRGGALVVAVNGDGSVRANKGPGHPVHPALERVEMLCAFPFVDLVTVFDDLTVDGLLTLLRPDVHAKGRDYTLETVPERETARALGIELAIVGDPKDHSSSEVLDRIRRGE